MNFLRALFLFFFLFSPSDMFSDDRRPKEEEKNLDERLKLLPIQVARLGADIIFFQEIWTAWIRDHLIEELKKYGYAYAAYDGNNYPGGNGLLIISRYELDPAVEKLNFINDTYKKYLRSKGVIKTRANLLDVGWVDLYNAHLIAPNIDYTTGKYSNYETDLKTFQTVELLDFIKNTRSSDVAILGADLNTHHRILTFRSNRKTNQETLSGEFAPSYTLVTEQKPVGFIDTFLAIHGEKEPPVSTYDTYKNRYAAQSWPDAPCERVDYIFNKPK